jgi:hypothetical protein
MLLLLLLLSEDLAKGYKGARLEFNRSSWLKRKGNPYPFCAGLETHHAVPILRTHLAFYSNPILSSFRDQRQTSPLHHQRQSLLQPQAAASAAPLSMSAMPSMKKKILLMGRSGCGKTSMRALVFSSALYSNPASTQRLGPTTGMELSTFRFLKNLLINLFDCGGQQTYMDSYVEDKREQVFKDVGAFVYVFDMGSANNEEGEDGWQGDLRYWR